MSGRNTGGIEKAEVRGAVAQISVPFYAWDMPNQEDIVHPVSHSERSERSQRHSLELRPKDEILSFASVEDRLPEVELRMTVKTKKRIEATARQNSEFSSLTPDF